MKKQPIGWGYMEEQKAEFPKKSSMGIYAGGDIWQIASDPLHFRNIRRVPHLGSELSVSALMVDHEMNYRVGNGPR